MWKVFTILILPHSPFLRIDPICGRSQQNYDSHSMPIYICSGDLESGLIKFFEHFKQFSTHHFLVAPIFYWMFLSELKSGIKHINNLTHRSFVKSISRRKQIPYYVLCLHGWMWGRGGGSWPINWPQIDIGRAWYWTLTHTQTNRHTSEFPELITLLGRSQKAHKPLSNITSICI